MNALDRNSVIRRYKQLCVELDLSPKQVVLGAGAALVMLGLRKYTNDLDVDVPREVFEKHKSRKGSKPGILNELVEWDGSVDIHPVIKCKNNVVEIEGVSIYHPSILLGQKEALISHPLRNVGKLPQDRKDINLLKECIDNVYTLRT